MISPAIKFKPLRTPEPDAIAPEELTSIVNQGYPAADPPIDFPTELNADIADFPYQSEDPIGWVRAIANVYWEPVEELIRHGLTLEPNIAYTALPGLALHRQWAKYSVSDRAWHPVELHQLPKLMLGADIESLKEGKGTETFTDPYRPFLLGFQGCNMGDGELSWYCWRDQLKGDEALVEVIPFPQDRVVINHNICGYDRRYFSCEYEQAGPSSNVYLDTRVLGVLMHGISDQADAQHKLHKNNEAEGLPVPYWVTQATRANLADLVEFRLGIKMDKTVREDFSDYTAGELAQRMYDRDNLEITPTSVFTYWASDVERTRLLWNDLFQEFDKRFASHPATYSGMCILGTMRCYLDGLDEFIEKNDALFEETKEKELRSVVKLLAEDLVAEAQKSEVVRDYSMANTMLRKAKFTKKQAEQRKKEAAEELEKVVYEEQTRYPEMGRLANNIETAKAEVKKLRGKTKMADLPTETLEEIAALKKRYSADQAVYKELSAQNKDDTHPDAIALRNRKEHAAADLATARGDLKLIADYAKEKAAAAESLREDYEAIGCSLCTNLDWSTFASGDRLGEIKWFAKLAQSNWSHGTRDAVTLLCLRWKGEPIQWVFEEGDSGLGTWASATEKLPHLGGGERLGSPLCKDYVRFVYGGELTSDRLSKERLLGLFEAIEATGQWQSYQSRYKSVYRVETPYGLCTTTDVVPGGTVTGRSTSSTFCVAPKKSDKIGSEIKEYFGPGKGRIVVERDFAAQESKYLAMGSDSLAGQVCHSIWSKAVLQGVKLDKTDIHNVVAGACSNNLLQGEDPVDRTAGKKLNFTSTYLCGVDKLAGVLIRDCHYTTERAYRVANSFMDLIKGPDGIALDEFAFLNLCANLPGFRTFALGRKIADSIDVAHCPKDFHTTRANFTIQSGCVDLLHIAVTVMWALIQEYDLDAFLLLTVHDSVAYSVQPKNEALFDRLLDYAHAVAKQCAYQGSTAWAREFQSQSNIPDLWCPRQDIYFEKD